MLGQEELQTIKENANNGGKVKININIMLDASVRNKVQRINNKIALKTDLEIMFGKDSVMHPHITLIMGTIKSMNDLQKVNQIVSNVLLKFNLKNGILIEFDNISVTKNEKWAMLWLKENEHITKLITSLKKELAGVMDISTFNIPHVTLAKGENLVKALDVIKQSVPPKNFVATNINVSLAGKNGTVLKNLSKICVCGEQKK